MGAQAGASTWHVPHHDHLRIGRVLSLLLVAQSHPGVRLGHGRSQAGVGVGQLVLRGREGGVGPGQGGHQPVHTLLDLEPPQLLLGLLPLSSRSQCKTT